MSAAQAHRWHTATLHIGKHVRVLRVRGVLVRYTGRTGSLAHSLELTALAMLLLPHPPIYPQAPPPSPTCWAPLRPTKAHKNPRAHTSTHHHTGNPPTHLACIRLVAEGVPAGVRQRVPTGVGTTRRLMQMVIAISCIWMQRQGQLAAPGYGAGRRTMRAQVRAGAAMETAAVEGDREGGREGAGGRVAAQAVSAGAEQG